MVNYKLLSETVSNLLYRMIHSDLFQIIFVGKYACQIVPAVQNIPPEVNSADVTVVVMATVFSMKGQTEVRSVPLLVPFLPPFYLHNAEIHVSTLTPVSSVRVSSSPKLADQVQVHMILYVSLKNFFREKLV